VKWFPNWMQIKKEYLIKLLTP